MLLCCVVYTDGEGDGGTLKLQRVVPRNEFELGRGGVLMSDTWKGSFCVSPIGIPKACR